MLDILRATEIVRKAMPNGKIQAVVSYKNLYLFQIFRNDPFEEEWDPFYSVDKKTGEFRDFSIITDGNISEIVSLFEEAKKKSK